MWHLSFTVDASGGASDDWMKAVANTKYVYCLELPPPDTGNDDHGFHPPPTLIAPTGKETWAAMRVIADQIVNQFGTSPSMRR